MNQEIKSSVINSKLKLGMLSGILATAGMSAVMMMGMLSGKSPMPQPIPIAMVKLLLGDAPKPLLMISGMLSHFIYGAVAGFIYLKVLKNRAFKIKFGLLYGTILWLIMQVLILPIIGWGAFGSSVNIKIAAATLLLHLVYGAVLVASLKLLSKIFLVKTN